jgi:hypothetical protein
VDNFNIRLDPEPHARFAAGALDRSQIEHWRVGRAHVALSSGARLEPANLVE